MAPSTPVWVRPGGRADVAAPVHAGWEAMARAARGAPIPPVPKVADHLVAQIAVHLVQRRNRPAPKVPQDPQVRREN